MSRLQVTAIFWGSEWWYLDNIKHLVFWLWNIKQLNFWHFNPKSKNFALSSSNFFFLKWNKSGSKKAQIILFGISKSFQSLPEKFSIISEDVRRLTNIPQDCWRIPKYRRRLSKISKDKRRFPRKKPENLSRAGQELTLKDYWFLFFTKTLHTPHTKQHFFRKQ